MPSRPESVFVWFVYGLFIFFPCNGEPKVELMLLLPFIVDSLEEKNG